MGRWGGWCSPSVSFVELFSAVSSCRRISDLITGLQSPSAGAGQYLTQVNRHIAELSVQIAHQRAIIKDALATGQRSAMAESLLDALEGSLRLFEKHRIFLLGCSVNRPSNGSSKRPDPPSSDATGQDLANARLGDRASCPK